MAVRAVVFDLFDTLVDLSLPRLTGPRSGGSPVHATVLRLHAALRGRADVGFEEFVAALGEVDRNVLGPLYRAGRECPTRERFARVMEALAVGDPELPDVLTRVHMGALRECMVTPPHHASTLARLRQRAMLGLCSNFSDAATARAVLGEAGLAEHLDTVVISEEVGVRKPRREIFDAALAHLGVEPREVLHVGDNLVADVSGAAEVGIRTVWITRRVVDPDVRLQEHGGPCPDFRVADLAEIEAILDSV